MTAGQHRTDAGTDRHEGAGIVPAGDEVHHFLGVSCFAEAVVCPEAAVLKIPEDLPMPIAALMGCAVMTGVGAVINTAHIEPGSTVLVIGAGGVGLAVLLGATQAGAGQIIVADLVDFKLEMARSLGATDTINASSADVVEEVRAITEDGVDYSFEVIGTGGTMAQAVRALRPAGVATLVGLANIGTSFEVNALDLVMQERTIKGSSYGSARPAVDVPQMFELYRTGRLPLDRLLTRTYRLDEINLAFQAMLSGEVARSVVIP